MKSIFEGLTEPIEDWAKKANRRAALRLKLEKRTYQPSKKKSPAETALDRELAKAFERNK